MRLFDKLDKIIDFHISYKLPKEIYFYMDKNEIESVKEKFELISKNGIGSAEIKSPFATRKYDCDLFIQYAGFSLYYINIESND